MIRRSDTALWAGAFGASIALHGALAASLALAPRPQQAEAAATNIAVQSLSRDIPDLVASTPVPQAEAPREAVGDVSITDAVTPVESAGIATTTAGAERRLAATGIASAIEPVHDAQLAGSDSRPSEVVKGGEADTAVLQPMREAQPVPAAGAPSALEQAPVAPQVAAVIEADGTTASAPGVASVAPLAEPVQSLLPAEVPGASVTIPAESKAAIVASAPAVAVADRLQMSGTNAAAVEIVLPAPGPVASTVPAQPAVRSDAVSASASAPAAVVSIPSASAAAVPSTVAPQPGQPVGTAASPPSVAAQSLGPDATVAVATRHPGQPGTQVAMLPVRPAAPVMKARPQVDPLQQVRNVIAGQSGQGCFLALATPSPQTIDVDGYSQMQEHLQQLHRDLAVISDASVNIRQHRITAAQCEALSFARMLSPDPVAQLPITSDSAEISSGAELSGTIYNFTRTWLYLLVVDDEGKVQELDDLTRNADGTVGFRAPFTLTDGPVDTVQLLMAVASDSALGTFERHEGEEASAYFAALAKEIASLGGGVEVGVAGFVIR